MSEGHELEPAPLLPSRLAHVSSEADVAETLASLGDTWTGRALLLVGGADFTDAALLAGLRAFLERVVRVCTATSMAVVDGGTDSGVMRLVAEARSAAGASFPLIGVTPAGALERRTSAGAEIRPAAGHSVVLLTPGSAFGDETEWLFLAADLLAGGMAPTVVVNGGRLSMLEARLRLERGCLVIAVAGSGRAADELASDDGLRASGRLRVIPLSADEAAIAEALEVEPQP